MSNTIKELLKAEQDMEALMSPADLAKHRAEKAKQFEELNEAAARMVLPKTLRHPDLSAFKAVADCSAKMSTFARLLDPFRSASVLEALLSEGVMRGNRLEPRLPGSVEPVVRDHKMEVLVGIRRGTVESNDLLRQQILDLKSLLRQVGVQNQLLTDTLMEAKMDAVDHHRKYLEERRNRQWMMWVAVASLLLSIAAFLVTYLR